MNKVETIADDRRHLLAPFRGAKPPAPEWFDDAIAHAPERTVVDVRGAAIETLAWGERGKPGLLFLHGNGACADWCSSVRLQSASSAPHQRRSETYGLPNIVAF